MFHSRFLPYININLEVRLKLLGARFLKIFSNSSEEMYTHLFFSDTYYLILRNTNKIKTNYYFIVNSTHYEQFSSYVVE